MNWFQTKRQLVALGFPACCFLMLGGLAEVAAAAEKDVREPEYRVRAALDAYDELVTVQPDKWWLTNVTGYSTELRAQLRLKKEEWLRVLAKYRSVNEFTERLYGSAQDLRLGAVRGGEFPMSLALVSGKGPAVFVVPEDAESFLPDNLSFFFRPQPVFQATGHRIGCPLYRESLSLADSRKAVVGKAGAVYLPAVELPELLFASSFYHEYGHAINILVDKRGRSRAAEEVAMHELEFAILKAGAPGYWPRIQAIARRNQPHNFKEAMANVTHSDLFELNLMILGPAPSDIASRSCVASHVLALGFAHVDARYDAATAAGAKAEVYQWCDAIVRREIGEDELSRPDGEPN